MKSMVYVTNRIESSRFQISVNYYASKVRIGEFENSEEKITDVIDVRCS